MYHLLIAVLALFSLAQCATSGSGTEPVNADSTSRYQLIIFSAPWCENCEPFIHGLDSKLSGQSSASLNRLSPEVRVVTGKKKFEKPTLQVAEEYVSALGVPYLAFADFWKTGNYSQYYGNESLNIPAVVIVSSTGEKRVFSAGTSADEVMGYLETVLK